jgi:polar amino acid transport system permease protein
MDYVLNFNAVWRDFDLLLSGLFLGLGLALISIFLGSIIGLFVAFALISKNRVLRTVSTSYVAVIRNVPILIIILLIYFGLPSVGILFDKLTSFIIALTVYSAAYIAEVFRGGLNSLNKGLFEAGLASGMTPFQTNRIILIPVMLRSVLPALSNNFISLFKDTSLAAVIAVPELTYYTRKINTESFRVVESWMVTSMLYVTTCFLIAVTLRQLEKRYSVPR